MRTLFNAVRLLCYPTTIASLSMGALWLYEAEPDGSSSMPTRSLVILLCATVLLLSFGAALKDLSARQRRQATANGSTP